MPDTRTADGPATGTIAELALPEVRRGFEYILAAIGRIDRKLPWDEAYHQLKVQQMAFVRLYAASSDYLPERLLKITLSATEAGLLGIWEDIEKSIESLRPGLPRRGDIERCRYPIVGTTHAVSLSRSDGIGAWVEHALSRVQIVADGLGSPAAARLPSGPTSSNAAIQTAGDTPPVRTDGLCPPNVVRVDGKDHELPSRLWRLLRYLVV